MGGKHLPEENPRCWRTSNILVWWAKSFLLPKNNKPEARARSRAHNHSAILSLLCLETWVTRQFAECGRWNRSLTVHFGLGACVFLVKYLLCVLFIIYEALGKPWVGLQVRGWISCMEFSFHSGSLAPAHLWRQMSNLGPQTLHPRPRPVPPPSLFTLCCSCHLLFTEGSSMHCPVGPHAGPLFIFQKWKFISKMTSIHFSQVRRGEQTSLFPKCNSCLKSIWNPILPSPLHLSWLIDLFICT